MLRRTAAAGLVLAVLACAYAAARHAPFLRVQDVRVAGVSGEQAPRIRAALARTARGMTTLAVDEDALRDAVAQYATVADLDAEADLPRALRIEVSERLPVAVVGGVAVAADGRPLRGVGTAGLPVVRGGTQTTRSLVRVLAAAPREVLPRAAAARETPYGPVVELRDGPVVLFGDTRRPRAKWLAATAVLGDERSRGASYVDVGVPERPVAGAEAPEGSLDAGAPDTSATAPQAAAGPGAATAAQPSPSTEG